MIHYDIYEVNGARTGKYAQVVEESTVTGKDFAHNIASRSTFQEHEVLPMIDCLSEEMEMALKAGKRVHIEGLGYFTLQITGEVVTNEKGTDVLRNAQVSDIRFRPEQQFLDRFFKIKVRHRRRTGQSVSSLTDEEILRTAARLSQQNGMFAPMQLEGALKLHRNQVYRLLKRLVSEGRLEKISIGPHQNFYRAVAE